MRRLHLIALPLLLCAAPALAQQPKAEVPLEQDMQIPPEMSDPRLANRLVDGLQALSKAFLALPAGDVEAALEGRAATAADSKRTIASETGLTEQQLHRKIDESRPAMQEAHNALMAALPALMKSMSEMGKELDKAAANMPQPGYPKR